MQVLKKLSQVLFEQTSDSSAFLNATYLLKYVLNCEQYFSYFDSDYPTSGLTVTGLEMVCCWSLAAYFCQLRRLPLCDRERILLWKLHQSCNLTNFRGVISLLFVMRNLNKE
jgi:hypothetical protein